MDGNHHAENYKECRELTPVINNGFLIYKQLFTQGTILSPKLDIKNKIL